MLRAYVCEQLNQDMVILLGSSSLAVVCCRIFELNALENRLDGWLVGVLVEALGIVDAAS